MLLLQKDTITGVFFLVAQERTKEGNFVAVNAADSKKLLYRSPPFLGGQRYTLACGAHSAPWKTRKMTREKASFFPWHLSSFSFTQELTWRYKPNSRKQVWFFAQLPSRVRVQGTQYPGAGYGAAEAPSFPPSSPNLHVLFAFITRLCYAVSGFIFDKGGCFVCPFLLI